MGSNGNHPLSRHEALIRANRMEYTRFHGEHCHIHMLTLGYDFVEVNFQNIPFQMSVPIGQKSQFSSTPSKDIPKQNGYGGLISMPLL